MNKIHDAEKGQLPQFGDAEVEAEASKHGVQHKVLGKDLISSIRFVAKEKGYDNVNSFGNGVPRNLANPMAPDVERLIRRLVA